MKGRGYYGVTRSRRNNAQMGTGWDQEEDIGVGAGDTDLEAGNFGHTTKGEAEPRNKYYARAFNNATATGAIVGYKLIDHSANFICYVAAGATYDVGQNIETLIGSGTTKVTTVKVLYIDRAVVDDVGETKTV